MGKPKIKVFRVKGRDGFFPERLLGWGTGDWAVMNGREAVARLGSLKRKKEQEPAKKGFFGRFKKMFAPSDSVIASAGAEHVLPAPAALGMHLLFREITSSSGE